VREKETAQEPLVRVEGMHNVLFLAAIMVAVFLTDRFFVREIVMLAAAAASYRITKPPVRAANAFTFGPIKEVGFLFVGIFLTMRPALDYLEVHGQEFGFQRPIHYYFASGSLSAVLDNAPTYLNFFTLAQSAVVPAEVKADGDRAAAAVSADEAARVRETVLVRWLLDEESRTANGARAFLFVVAVSLGSVFFGAMTYIGNGPNFMVKSIADASDARTPTFFGYVFKYSLPILLPILAIVPFMFL
jgi:Na+/H+ antiporter NhaD/arsenite permease-like protein